MKVLLINPPFAFPDNVYASVPILLGQLKNAGIDAKAMDLNIEFIKDILNKDYLEKTVEKLNYILQTDEVKNIDEKYSLTKEQQVEQKLLIEKCLIKQKNITETIIKSSDNLWDSYLQVKNIQNSKKTENIKKAISYAMSIAFMPYYPSTLHISFGSGKNLFYFIEENPIYKNTYEDLMYRCNNEERNIYVGYFKEKIIKQKLNEYDVIAITIPFESCFYPALTFARTIKEYTNAKVIIGGVLINSIVDSFKKHPEMFGQYFDALMLGEGEKSIVDYVNVVESGSSLSSISGLVYKNQETIVQNPIEYINNVDSVAEPAYDGLDFSNYVYPKISMEFSKGCYWSKCLYCYCNLYKRYHIKNPKLAVDMIENLINKYGIRSFHILDDSLNINFARIFAQEIISRNLNIKYSAFFRLEEALTRDFLELMCRSGLNSIFFGLESASEKILKLMNKGINVSTAERILKDSFELGIETSVGFMYGFPSESEKDLNDTLDFIKRNRKYITKCNNFKFTLLKSSALLKFQQQLNITNIREIEEFSAYLLYDADNLDDEKFNSIMKKNNISYLNRYTKWEV